MIRLTRQIAPLLFVVACTGAPSSHDGPLLVYDAASIARPMRAVLDSFALRTGTRYSQESASSLELVRRLTELQSTPDVLALADPDLFPSLLEPAFTSWHALFGRNRIVLAYTSRSRGAGRALSLDGRARIEAVIADLAKERGLRERDIELLRDTIAGEPRAKILQRRAISPNTFKTHVRLLVKKLDVPSMQDAALVILRRALETE